MRTSITSLSRIPAALGAVVIALAWPATGTAGADTTAPTDSGDPTSNALIIHYTPSADEPGRLVDRSGNGHHAELFGGEFIESPRGMAVRFDGEDDYASLAALSLPGDSDLTIEMWLKFDQLAHTHPRGSGAYLLFGDPHRFTMNRMFSLRTHPRQLIYLEYGSEVASGNAVPDRSLVLNGKQWQHLAVVIDDGFVHFYLDGTHYGGQKLAQPLKHFKNYPIHIAGWPFGYAKMDLDELRVYSRALSERELFGDTAVARRSGHGELKVRQVGTEASPYVDLRLWTTPDDDVTLEVIPKSARYTRVPNAEPVRDIIRVANLESDTGRYRLKPLLDTALDPGWYEVRAYVALNGREQVLSETIELGDPWLTSNIAKELKLMWPWTPVKVLDAGDLPEGSLALEVWGRRYQFGPSGLIEAVHSRQRPLLSGPVEVLAQLGDGGVQWSGGHAELIESEDAFAEVQQRFTSDAGLTLSVHHRIEFDGFVLTNVTLDTNKTVSLEGLGISADYLRDESELFYTWPLKPRGSADQLSGALDTTQELPFKPIVFLGSDDAGFAWYFESYEGWSDWKSPGAVALTPKPDGLTAVDFAIRREKTVLEPGQPLNYEFAWQATPVKPMATTGAEHRDARITRYAREMELPDETFDGEPALKRMADLGTRSIISWQTGNAFSYPIPLDRHNEFGRFIKEAKKYGIQVQPYVVGFLISIHAPEFWDHKDALTQKPNRGFGFDTRVNLKDGDYRYASLYGPWPDLMVHRVQELIDTYPDIGGIYMDSTGALFKQGEVDMTRGAGWMDEYGTVHPTWPITETRDLMRRLYSVVVDSDTTRQRVMDLHLHDTYNPATMAYATIAWHGEALKRGAVLDLEKYLPPDRVRTEFVGTNVGVPVDMLTHSVLAGRGQERMNNFKKLVDYLAPFGIWTRPTGIEQLEYMSQKLPVPEPETP